MGVPVQALDRPTLERRYRRSLTWNALLGALALLLVFWVAVGASGQGVEAPQGAPAADDQTQTQAQGQAESAPQECPVQDRRDANDTMAIGNVDAPIVVHEWTDYRCPYCGAFTRDTLPVLIDEYVETGKVRLEIHDAALVGGENSVLTATAARAAGEQGRYFEYMHAVYDGAEERGKNELNPEQLTGLAEEAGVGDLARFKQDMEREDLRAAVMESTERAQSVGVTGVPFFVTSNCGEVLSGAQPIETFRETLDRAVAAAG